MICEVEKIGMSFGSNGFCDVQFWKPQYPTDINEIISGQNAVEVIRELVIKVDFLPIFAIRILIFLDRFDLLSYSIPTEFL